MINFYKFFIQLIAELIAKQAVAGGVNGEFFHKLKQINFAGITPPSNHLFDFLNYHLSITTHRFIAQHLHQHFQLLIFFIRRRIKNHAFAKNRRHDFIRLALIQLSVRRAKKSFIGFRAGHQHHFLMKHTEFTDFSQCFS